MKCARPKCPNTWIAAVGLCEKHYEAIPKGFVDAQPVITHYQALRAAGLSCDHIAKLAGVNRDTLAKAGTWSDNAGVRLETAERVLAVPIPSKMVDGGALVDATGTRRRLQALMVIGWPLRLLGVEMQRDGDVLGEAIRTRRVKAKTAADVAAVYERLCMTPGPSDQGRRRALAKGWVPPLSWDDIDDPDETPDMGDVVKVEFPDQFRELREHCGLPLDQIADRMGVKLESLERQLMRHGLFEGRAA